MLPSQGRGVATMRCLRLVGRLVLLAAMAFNTAAGAQEQAKIEIVPIIAHSGAINALSYSRDGSRALSGSSDATLKLWDATSGRLIRTFEDHSGEVLTVAFSPSGGQLLSGSKDKTLKLWDAATGDVIRTFTGHTGPVVSAVFSPDGKRLLSGSSDKSLKLWDATTGKLIRTVTQAVDAVVTVAFSPDGKQLLSSGGALTLGVWDAESGKLIRSIRPREKVFSAAFSSDGTRLLTGIQDNVGTQKLWDVATGKLLRTVESRNWLSATALSSDGSRWVSPGLKLKLWDAGTGKYIETEPHNIGNAAFELSSTAFAFSPDGAYLLSGDLTTLSLWDAASGQLIRTFDAYSNSVQSLAVSADGTRLLSGSSDMSLKMWDATGGQLIRTFRGHSSWVSDVAFSSDGARLLSASQNGEIRLWDTASGQPVLSLGENDGRPVYSVAFSPDGKYLLSGGFDATSTVWDRENGKQVSILAGISPGHTRVVSAVAFSPDGKRILSASADKTLKLWDVAIGRMVREPIRTFEGHTDTVLSAKFSPDGARLVSGSLDRTVRLWDAETGQLLRTFEGHAGSVNSVAFSPDGKRLLSGSKDKTVRLWDADTGELLRTFAGHKDSVQSVAFSPDGLRLFSAGSRDSTVKIWSVATGQLLASVFSSASDEWLVMTPEGFFDTSAKGADMLSVVRGLQAYGIDQLYQALYRPDLVREQLAGDPDGKVSQAAARLDLAKLLDSGPAPRVVITSHKAQNASIPDRVTVEARLTDEGGGIGRAEWRINGITVGVVAQVAGAAGQPIALSQTMDLDPGKNIIELVAYNGANLVASTPARARIAWAGTEPTVPPRLYVVVVGINAYLDASLELTYSVPDAKSIAAAFKEAGQGQYEDVSITQVLDRDATAAKLDQIFQDLATRVRPRDVFVFYAAGHGKTVDGRYYFLPSDMHYKTEQSLAHDAIGQDKLQAWFAHIPAKKAVLMFDTCEAGSLTQRSQTRGLEQKAALGRLIQTTGRATLTASTATQAAYEGYGGHGVFTFALLDALARGDLNSNGLVELTELIQYVDGLVPAITEKQWHAKQYPQMDAYGSNFPLVRQVATLAPAQGSAIIVPVKPTHVNTETLQVFRDAGGSGEIMGQLPPFTTVAQVKSEHGWMLIGKDGQAMGYVAEDKLHKLN